MKTKTKKDLILSTRQGDKKCFLEEVKFKLDLR